MVGSYPFVGLGAALLVCLQKAAIGGSKAAIVRPYLFVDFFVRALGWERRSVHKKLPPS